MSRVEELVNEGDHRNSSLQSVGESSSEETVAGARPCEPCGRARQW